MKQTTRTSAIAAGIQAMSLPPKPMSPHSWWVNVPRDAFPDAVERERKRMSCSTLESRRTSKAEARER